MTTDFSYPLEQLTETDSTNRYLNQLCDERPADVAEFTTILADHQTAGKGQRGNSWESEGGKNLLFSFVLYPSFVEARRQFVLSQLVALAIKETLEAYSAGFTVKWPNDIYWEEKKICGILIENDLQGSRIGRCIVGIGLNVNQERFVSNAPNPVSLMQITGHEHDRHDLLGDLMRHMHTYYQQLKAEPEAATAEIARRYEVALFRRTGLHPYSDPNGHFMARMRGVEADGRLVLEDEKGEIRKYWFKEVRQVGNFPK